MKKRKKDIFSASRVIVSKPKAEREAGAETVRGAKHKEKLEALIERAD
jgi:hypothetical protein